MSKDNKDLTPESEKDGTISGTTSLTKGQQNIDEALLMFEQSYYTVPEHDAESGFTKQRKPVPPTFKTVRKLKQRNPDYRPGEVKVYTKEEIDEYERNRLS